MGDEYRRRMLAIADELRAQHISRYRFAPPVYWLAWKLGWNVRPPLYQSFASLALGAGALFGIGEGFVVWCLLWHGEVTRITPLVVAAPMLGGILVGLAHAGRCRWKARRLRLPPLKV